MYAMASQRAIVALFVLCLLCFTSVAVAKRQYLSVNMDDLLSSKAHVDCPPTEKSVTTSGKKITIPAACGFPPRCGHPSRCGSDADSVGRDILNHDIRRLTTLLRRSSVSQQGAAGLSAAAPVPRISVAPAPSAVPRRHPISSPPVAPPAEPPSVTIPDSSGTSLNTLEFVVTVGFGTPAQPSLVSFDTGSDVSWIQCQPCSGHCYHQHDPLFDPSKSSTYSAVPCGDPQCSAAGGRCNGTTCLYNVEYGDGSSTSGALSHETLTLTSSRTLPGFAFGCAQDNLGSFGDVDGLIGLGRGKLSLASQAAASSFGATFSYCLPSRDDKHGYLTIGSTPVQSREEVQYTAMVQKQEYPSLYFVELVSIDVAGFVLPVPPTVFTSSGTLLDSGTILTYLPEEAYTALRNRFRFEMNGKGYTPAPAYDILDTCYDFTGRSPIIPGVNFKFSDGAVFHLDLFGIMVFPEKPAVGCLAFVPRAPMMPFTIFGNIQQRSAEVIYDVAAEKIGFVPASC